MNLNPEQLADLSERFNAGEPGNERIPYQVKVFHGWMLLYIEEHELWEGWTYEHCQVLKKKALEYGVLLEDNGVLSVIQQ